jgi:hypothetical protein
MPMFGTANESDAGAIVYGVALVVILGIPFFLTSQLISYEMAKFG